MNTSVPNVRTVMDNTNHSELYALVEPFDTGFLPVSDIHTLYYEQAGNPNGKPVVVLHGGPGGGCDKWYRQFFNPEVFRVVLFDQRGAGRSTPFAELRENDTWSLVDDIEKIRKHLGIDKWHTVFGGSWGSTLAMAYAQTYTSVVKSLVLRGIFTLRRAELEYFYQGPGTNWVFADAWEQYVATIPEEERGDMIAAYYKRLTGDDKEEQIKCARAWSTWEMATSRLIVDPEMLKKGEDDTFALAFSRIESHYFVNKGFFESDDHLLKNAAATLSNIPIIIVQGRYDMVCPFASAWELHKQLPNNSELIIIPDAGHSMKERGIMSELIKACDKFGALEF